MYEWMLIIATHVNSGSNLKFERFADKTECIAVKDYLIKSHSDNGIRIETNLQGNIYISCMKVKKL